VGLPALRVIKSTASGAFHCCHRLVVENLQLIVELLIKYEKNAGQILAHGLGQIGHESL